MDGRPDPNNDDNPSHKDMACLLPWNTTKRNCHVLCQIDSPLAGMLLSTVAIQQGLFLSINSSK